MKNRNTNISNGMKKGEEYAGITIVYLCHDGEGNFLLNKRGSNCRDEQGTWDCGGGGLDFGERVEGTLKKEIAEEYGTSVLNFEFLGYRDVHRMKGGKKTHWIALDFKVLVEREKAKNNEPHKFDEIGWFPLGSFPEPLHSQLPNALRLYKEKL